MNRSWRCAICGGPMAQPDTGRPRFTCSDACRSKLYRNRSFSRQADRLDEAAARLLKGPTDELRHP